MCVFCRLLKNVCRSFSSLFLLESVFAVAVADAVAVAVVAVVVVVVVHCGCVEATAVAFSPKAPLANATSLALLALMA